MKTVRNLSIITFLYAASFCMNKLMSMESTPLLYNAVDLSGPSQLLESIKTLQVKKESPVDIAHALKMRLRHGNKKLAYISNYATSDKVYFRYNILYYLDATCNRDTVSIILSSFDTEKEACEFITTCDAGPSGLEHMLRNNNQECALPMIEILRKNKIKISLARSMFIGMSMETIDIDAMATQARINLESPGWFSRQKKLVSDVEVLVAVMKELKNCLNRESSNPEYWLGYFDTKSY